jgi:hypothetical protein
MMVKRKRAPGGGRKPTGRTVASSTVNVRIEPALRRALEAEVQARGAKSVSALVVKLIDQGLTKKAPTAKHNLSLGYSVALIAELVEKRTGRSWRDDSWTRQAVVYGVEVLLERFLPTDEANPPIPPAIEKFIANRSSDYAQMFSDSKDFGLLLGGNLVHEIEQAASNPIPTEMTQPIFFSERPDLLALIGRDLEKVVKEINRKGKSK